MSQSKVSRIETGRLLPSVLDVDLMLQALGVDSATRDEFLTLARVANAEYQDNRAKVRRGLHHWQRELAALETDAVRMRHFLPALITGLLQTPGYMHIAMNTDVDPGVIDTSKAIAIKLQRQAVLHDPSKRSKTTATCSNSSDPAPCGLTRREHLSPRSPKNSGANNSSTRIALAWRPAHS
jgi:hypothetical protein